MGRERDAVQENSERQNRAPVRFTGGKLSVRELKKRNEIERLFRRIKGQ